MIIIILIHNNNSMNLNYIDSMDLNYKYKCLLNIIDYPALKSVTVINIKNF